MTRIRSVQVARAGGPFELIERDTPEPGRGQVRVAVEACGVCHSDHDFAAGHFPAATFPLVPGHEIAGRIDALGPDVEGWEPGERVAVGWFGGSCGHCVACREGDFISCAELKVPGVAYRGGYADALVVPSDALARVPGELAPAEVAPMGCAGVTVFNALRRSAARPGDLVAILGIGGLGHLAVQFAAKLGFETVAIARGDHRRALARELGAHHYVDGEGDVAGALQRLGGAKVVLATATSSAAMAATIDGLGHRGELIVIGASPEPIEVSPLQLILGSKTVHGHPSGTAREVEETLRFAALTGVRPLIERVELGQAASAVERMLSGEARFRMVLETGR